MSMSVDITLFTLMTQTAHALWILLPPESFLNHGPGQGSSQSTRASIELSPQVNEQLSKGNFRKAAIELLKELTDSASDSDGENRIQCTTTGPKTQQQSEGSSNFKSTTKPSRARSTHSAPPPVPPTPSSRSSSSSNRQIRIHEAAIAIARIAYTGVLLCYRLAGADGHGPCTSLAATKARSAWESATGTAPPAAFDETLALLLWIKARVSSRAEWTGGSHHLAWKAMLGHYGSAWYRARGRRHASSASNTEAVGALYSLETVFKHEKRYQKQSMRAVRLALELNHTGALGRSYSGHGDLAGTEHVSSASASGSSSTVSVWSLRPKRPKGAPFASETSGWDLPDDPSIKALMTRVIRQISTVSPSKSEASLWSLIPLPVRGPWDIGASVVTLVGDGLDVMSCVSPPIPLLKAAGHFNRAIAGIVAGLAASGFASSVKAQVTGEIVEDVRAALDVVIPTAKRGKLNASSSLTGPVSAAVVRAIAAVGSSVRAPSPAFSRSTSERSLPMLSKSPSVTSSGSLTSGGSSRSSWSTMGPPKKQTLSRTSSSGSFTPMERAAQAEALAQWKAEKLAKEEEEMRMKALAAKSDAARARAEREAKAKKRRVTVAGIVLAQAHVRGMLTRIWYRDVQLNMAAITIQAMVRGMLVRARLRRGIAAVVILQARWRGHLVREAFRSIEIAVERGPTPLDQQYEDYVEEDADNEEEEEEEEAGEEEEEEEEGEEGSDDAQAAARGQSPGWRASGKPPLSRKVPFASKSIDTLSTTPCAPAPFPTPTFGSRKTFEDGFGVVVEDEASEVGKVDGEDEVGTDAAQWDGHVGLGLSWVNSVAQWERKEGKPLANSWIFV